MKRFESKAVFTKSPKSRFSLVMSSAGGWVAPMIVWVVVSGMMLVLVCVLVAPVE